MAVKVHVNKQRIFRNLKRGENEPPIAIRRGSKVEYGYEVELIGKAKIVYRPNKPLKCGAKSWIEADDAVVIEPAQD